MKFWNSLFMGLFAGFAVILMFTMHYAMIQHGDYYQETCKYDACIKHDLSFSSFNEYYFINESFNNEINNNWQCLCEGENGDKKAFYIENSEYIKTGWYKLMFKIAAVVSIISFIVFLFIKEEKKEVEKNE